MSTPLVNYTGASEPEVGDANPTASAQVAGAATSVAKALDGHDHTAGKGLGVPFAGLAAGGDLDMGENPAVNMTYIQFNPPIAAGSAPNRSLFVDEADERIKYRDNTGTVRTLTWTP